MRRTVYCMLSAGVGLVLLMVTTRTTNADLTINLSPDGLGGTNLEFDGSGTVIDLGSGPGNFAYEDPTNTFFIPVTGTYSDDFITPFTPPLGGGIVDTFFTAAADGGGAYGPYISWFWIGDVVGGDLTTANGLVFNLDTIPFANLHPGSYALSRFGNTADVGDVTLNIVPEPSAFALASLGLLGLACCRRKMH
jgi:hypothetical protein